MFQALILMWQMEHVGAVELGLEGRGKQDMAVVLVEVLLPVSGMLLYASDPLHWGRLLVFWRRKETSQASEPRWSNLNEPHAASQVSYEFLILLCLHVFALPSFEFDI